MNFLIVGYGGIGQALTEKILSQQGHYVTVISRKAHPELQYHIEADFTDPDQTESLLNQLQGKPDVVINTIGMLHDASHQPEKSLSQVTKLAALDSIAINTLPLAYLLNILQTMLTKKPVKVITLSARVSSVSDNHLGGWHSYRMSKCALNMLMRNISIEWKRTHPNYICCAYHPGTVDSPLSKPFQANVKPDHLFSTEKLLQGCINLSTTVSQSIMDSLLISIKLSYHFKGALLIAIHWFRQDLRLHDNPALESLKSLQQVVVPLFIFDTKHAKDFAPGELHLGGYPAPAVLKS